ncbi:MAG: penicillin-binding protein 1C [bacterium]
MFKKFFFFKKRIICQALLIILLLFTFMLYRINYISPEDLLYPSNLIIKDREERTLRFFVDKNGERHLWVPSGEVPVLLKNAFIAAEDENFYSHYGFCLSSIARAVKDNLAAGRIVSGASTITQQVVKLIKKRRRTFLNKFVEVVESVKLEMELGKEKIMEQYLNRVPLGNNLRGVKIASEVYFEKKCSELNVLECALLASLPKVPGSLDYYGNYSGRLEDRKNWVLRRMSELGYISEKEFNDAKNSGISFKMKRFPMEGPHFVDFVSKKYSGLTGDIVTTLDSGIQKNIEKIIKSHRDRLNAKGANQSAFIMVRNSTMEVLSMAGSFEYSEKAKGFNNGTNALRSPGSTLKPFLYALALDSGYSPSLILSDIEKIFKAPSGDYMPRNYDRKEYGPVTMRTALASSLNLSTINLIEQVGYEEFYNTLKKMNLINYPDKGPEYFGLGMAIGNPEITLQQLAAAYAMLASGGIYRPLKFILNEEEEAPRFVFSPQASYIITDFLSDYSAKMLTFSNKKLQFPFKAALKTGTSTNYRDAWVIAYTPEYTFGVWTGNFEGRPTYNLNGEDGAVPVLYDVLVYIYNKANPGEFQVPAGLVSVKVCSFSGMPPTADCSHLKEELFIEKNVPETPCIFHLKNNESRYLPVNYAAWLYEKNRKGTVGNNKLAGFEEDLDRVFQKEPVKPVDKPAINVKEGEVFGDETIEKEWIIVENSHHSIGNGADISRYNVFNGPEGHIRITYPLDGDRYVIDKDFFSQVIDLQVIVGKPAEHVKWYVDGIEYAKVRPPYKADWELEKGLHRLTAIDSFNNADEVRIMVE